MTKKFAVAVAAHLAVVQAEQALDSNGTIMTKKSAVAASVRSAAAVAAHLAVV